MRNAIGAACRMLRAVALLLAVLAGQAVAEDATLPPDASGAATGPVASADAPPAADPLAAGEDCGCGARSPAQLFETQRRMAEPAAEPGS
jgi:hypothetical protein